MNFQEIIELLDMFYESSERTRQRLRSEASLSDLLMALDKSPSDTVREHLCTVLREQSTDTLLNTFQGDVSPLVKSWLCSILQNRPERQVIHALILYKNGK